VFGVCVGGCGYIGVVFGVGVALYFVRAELFMVMGQYC